MRVLGRNAGTWGMDVSKNCNRAGVTQVTELVEHRILNKRGIIYRKNMKTYGFEVKGTAMALSLP